MVFCRAPGTVGPYGIGVVLVERGTPGFEVLEIERKMGGRGMNEVVLGFDKVPVRPDQVVMMRDAGSKAGAQFLLVQFNPERCGHAALSMGLGLADSSYSMYYTKQRTKERRGGEELG